MSEKRGDPGLWNLVEVPSLALHPVVAAAW